MSINTDGEDKKDRLIEALKVSNQERQLLIDDLLREDLIKLNVIRNLMREIEALRKRAAKKKEISDTMYRIFR